MYMHTHTHIYAITHIFVHTWSGHIQYQVRVCARVCVCVYIYICKCTVLSLSATPTLFFFLAPFFYISLPTHTFFFNVCRQIVWCLVPHTHMPAPTHTRTHAPTHIHTRTHTALSRIFCKIVTALSPKLLGRLRKNVEALLQMSPTCKKDPILVEQSLISASETPPHPTLLTQQRNTLLKRTPPGFLRSLGTH